MIEPDEEEESGSPGLLGPRDLRILDAFLVVGSIPRAANIAGVNRTTGWRVSKTPAFQGELHRRLEERARVARLRLLEQQEPAWTVIGQLLSSPDERIRAKIATWIADRGLTEAHLQDREPAPTELQLHLESMERRLLAELTDPSAEAGDADA